MLVTSKYYLFMCHSHRVFVDHFSTFLLLDILEPNSPIFCSWSVLVGFYPASFEFGMTITLRQHSIIYACTFNDIIIRIEAVGHTFEM